MALAVLVLGLAVTGTAAFSFFVAQPKVTSKDIGFNIIDPRRATVDFEVTRASDTTVQCAVQVLSESYAIVGWKVVTVPGGPESAGTQMQTAAFRADVRTESLGTSGGVNACWTVEN